MGINGLSAIGIMLAFVGIAVSATIALREWVFRQAARNLEACFSDAAHQLPYANLPSLALETLAVLRTPSRRSALTRSHWVSTQRSIAWGCAVLDTAAPDLQLTDPRLRRWFRGILADAKRHVPAKVFVSARQFAADSVDGRSERTTTHPSSWLPGGPISSGQPVVLEPGEDIVPPTDFDWMRNGRWPVPDAPAPTMKGAPHVPWLHPTVGDRLLQDIRPWHRSGTRTGRIDQDDALVPPLGNDTSATLINADEIVRSLRDGQPVLVPFKIDADSEPVRLEMSPEDRRAWWVQRAKAAANATGHPCVVQSADFVLYAVPDTEDTEVPS